MTNGLEEASPAYLNLLAQEWHSHEFTVSYLPQPPTTPAALPDRAVPAQAAELARHREQARLSMARCGRLALFDDDVQEDEWTVGV